MNKIHLFNAVLEYHEEYSSNSNWVLNSQDDGKVLTFVQSAMGPDGAVATAGSIKDGRVTLQYLHAPYTLKDETCSQVYVHEDFLSFIGGEDNLSDYQEYGVKHLAKILEDEANKEEYDTWVKSEL